MFLFQNPSGNQLPIFSMPQVFQSYYEPRSIGAYSKKSLNQIMAIIKKKTLTYETLWKKDKIIS